MPAIVFLWHLFKKDGPRIDGRVNKGFKVCEQVSLYQLKFCEKRWHWSRRKMISCEHQSRFLHGIWDLNEVGYVVLKQRSSSYSLNVITKLGMK